jgi:hypothetical protein
MASARLRDRNLSPYDRLAARRRRTFIRDWILVLIALGLMAAAGAFHPSLNRAEPGQPASATTVPR